MTTSTKILISAGVILLLSLFQMALAQQLVLETSSGVFTARSPILVAMSVVQVIFGVWALADVSQKITEDTAKPPHKHKKNAK